MNCQDKTGRDGSCELDNRLNASIRIGLVGVDEDGSDLDFSVSNFGSRLRWGGETELDNGLNGIGYLEFGVNPDENDRGNSGVDRTRQAWIGLSGDFGAVKIGAQYAAFYDMISSHTDIAYWGSCWTQEECARQTRVLKYEGESGSLSYAASFTGAPNDDESNGAGDAFADEIEGGVNVDLGNFTLGLAATFQADEEFVGEDGLDVDDDGGLLLGAVAKGSFGDSATLALGLQLADEDFVDGTEDLTNVTLAGTYGSAYVVANVGDDGDNSPYFATLGYASSLDPASVLYYEAQIVDSDSVDEFGEDVDATLIGRIVYIYTFNSTVLMPMEN